MDVEHFSVVVEALSVASAVLLGQADMRPEGHRHIEMPDRTVCVYSYRRQSDGVTIEQYLDPAQPTAVIIKMHAPVEEVMAYGDKLAEDASDDPVVQTLEAILQMPDATPGDKL